MASLKIRREQIIELEIKAETLQKNVIVSLLTFKILKGKIFGMHGYFTRSAGNKNVFIW